MIQSVRGTKDILPDTVALWQFVENKFREISSLFCYDELRTPIFEKTEVFHRSIGEETDIVNKEMYTFLDKGGESITLRPEMTAALVRAVIQNSMLSQSGLLKLWYFGPFFRYERPQKGRLRQFHQFGAECIGSPYPESDVEVILLADTLFKALGIENYNLLINSLGNENSRKMYRDALINYLDSVKDDLSYDSKSRMDKNPLRVLDSKDEKDVNILVNAPRIIDYLDEPSLSHFNKVKVLLDNQNVKYIISPKLVRGLDYYSHTVFEFQSSYLGSQDSFGGGGRYDGLIGQLGGKDTPAVGFALGVERLLMIIEAINNKNNELITNPDFFIIGFGDEAEKYSQESAMILRNRNFKVAIDLNRRSMKAQLREANRLNVKYSICLLYTSPSPRD